jgi:hypothetical protein
MEQKRGHKDEKSSGKSKSFIFLWYDTDRMKNEAANNFYIVVCAFVP